MVVLKFMMDQFHTQRESGNKTKQRSNSWRWFSAGGSIVVICTCLIWISEVYADTSCDAVEQFVASKSLKELYKKHPVQFDPKVVPDKEVKAIDRCWKSGNAKELGKNLAGLLVEIQDDIDRLTLLTFMNRLFDALQKANFFTAIVRTYNAFVIQLDKEDNDLLNSAKTNGLDLSKITQRSGEKLGDMAERAKTDLNEKIVIPILKSGKGKDVFAFILTKSFPYQEIANKYPSVMQSLKTAIPEYTEANTQKNRLIESYWNLESLWNNDITWAGYLGDRLGDMVSTQDIDQRQLFKAAEVIGEQFFSAKYYRACVNFINSMLQAVKVKYPDKPVSSVSYDETQPKPSADKAINTLAQFTAQFTDSGSNQINEDSSKMEPLGNIQIIEEEDILPTSTPESPSESSSASASEQTSVGNQPPDADIGKPESSDADSGKPESPFWEYFVGKDHLEIFCLKLSMILNVVIFILLLIMHRSKAKDVKITNLEEQLYDKLKEEFDGEYQQLRKAIEEALNNKVEINELKKNYYSKKEVYNIIGDKFNQINKFEAIFSKSEKYFIANSDKFDFLESGFDCMPREKFFYQDYGAAIHPAWRFYRDAKVLIGLKEVFAKSNNSSSIKKNGNGSHRIVRNPTVLGILSRFEDPTYVKAFLSFSYDEWVYNDFWKFADNLLMYYQNEIQGNEGAASDWEKGIEQVKKILENGGIEPILVDVKNEEYDKEKHEIKMTDTIGSVYDNHIVAVLATGYKREGIVKRPKVVVNKL